MSIRPVNPLDQSLADKRLTCIDEFAVQLNMREELKEALIKLHKNNLSSPHNDPLYSAYHHSHPTLLERLKAMDRYKPTNHLKLRGEKEL
jgi:STE24 endopeptidase